MGRRSEDLGGRAFFDHLPQVHDDHVVRADPHSLEVMGDQHERDMELVLETLQEGQYLPAHAQVERRGRLVQHNELGIGRQRPGDSRPLELASAQRPGFAVPEFLAEAHGRQHLGEALVLLCS